MSSKDNDEGCVIHSKSDNIKVMINDKADKVIEELFQSLLYWCQIGLEISIKVSYFKFACIHLLYCKCHKATFKRGEAYINPPDCIRNKNLTINAINKFENKCYHSHIKP